MAVFGFIGVGNMGGALARTVAAGAGAESSILLSDYDSLKADSLASRLGASAVDNTAIAQNADYIFLGVKPQVLPSVLGELAEVLAKRESRFVLISMAAGVSIASVLQAAGGSYPVIRIMPNLPVQSGEGVILYSLGLGTTAEDEQCFLQALSNAGECVLLKEGLIDAGMAVSGCGPAFVDLFAEAMADGAVACGLPRDIALRLTLQTIKGAAVLAQESGKSPAVLKDEVCSPGGTTIQGVLKLEEYSFRAAVAGAVRAAYEKNFNLK